MLIFVYNCLYASKKEEPGERSVDSGQIHGQLNTRGQLNASGKESWERIIEAIEVTQRDGTKKKGRTETDEKYTETPDKRQ